ARAAPSSDGRSRWESGDALLAAHIARGAFAVARPRSQRDFVLDSRAFSLLLCKVAEACRDGGVERVRADGRPVPSANFSDAAKVLDRMQDADLSPSWSNLVALLNAASGAAENGTLSPQDIAWTLELFAAMEYQLDAGMEHLETISLRMERLCEDRRAFGVLESKMAGMAGITGQLNWTQVSRQLLQRMSDNGPTPSSLA
ncbi:hypothetical protein T484DRAFT_1762401, partial [Baffinella frigidus]